jgi:hypothetical protein
MAIGPTKVAEPGDVILTRKCWIEAPDGEVSPLILSFMRPTRRDEDTLEGALRLECKHFDKIERMFGQDEVQVLARLFWIGRIALEVMERDGYSIWYEKKGDLHPQRISPGVLSALSDYRRQTGGVLQGQ